MLNKLLAVIAISLTLITGLLVLHHIPTAQAQSQRSDYALKRFIEENCWVELNAIKKNASGDEWLDIACYQNDGY